MKILILRFYLLVGHPIWNNSKMVTQPKKITQVVSTYGQPYVGHPLASVPGYIKFQGDYADIKIYKSS